MVGAAIIIKSDVTEIVNSMKIDVTGSAKFMERTDGCGKIKEERRNGCDKIHDERRDGWSKIRGSRWRIP